MKTWKRSLAFVLALCMMLSLTAFAGYEDYSDVDELTYVETVDVLSELGIIEGDETGAIDPTANLTRAWAARLVSYILLGKRAADALQTDVALFTDVPAEHWAAGYIAYCVDQGLISGMGDGTFAPEASVTASQFAKMLLCAVGYGQKGEFTGASWDSTVNAQAFKLGIFDGNEENVVFANVVTREEAWLYTFNALTKVMEINYNEETDEYYAGDISDPIRGFDFHETLGAKLYDLSKKAATDIFGREGHYWYKGATKIAGMYVDPAEAVYTAVVKSGTLFADLDLDVSTLATVYRNGKVQEDFLIEADSTAKIGGNGVLIEAAVDEEGKVTLIIIDTYLAKITDVDTNYEEVILDVWMNGDGTTTESMAYMPTDLKEGEYALVTVVDGEVQTLARAEIINGILDARGVTRTYATLEGTKYSYSAHLDQSSEDVYHIEFDREMIMLLDEYGYMIGLMPEGADRGMEYTINRMGMYDMDTHEEYKAIPKAQFLLEVDVTNECSSQIDTIMLVQYSADGQMLNIQYLYGKMNVGESYIFGATIDNRDGHIGCIKAFVVPTVGNMVPLAEAVFIGKMEQPDYYGDNAISSITVSSWNTDSVSAFGIEEVDDGEFVAEIEDYITMNSDDILEIKVNTYDSDAAIWIESDEDSDYGSDNEWMEIEISSSEWDDGVVVLYITVEESDGYETFYTLYIYID